MKEGREEKEPLPGQDAGHSHTRGDTEGGERTKTSKTLPPTPQKFRKFRRTKSGSKRKTMIGREKERNERQKK